METFSALLAICAGNSLVPGEFSTQRSVTRSFDVFFDLRLHKRLSKQSGSWWFATLLRPLWRLCNDIIFLPIWRHQSMEKLLSLFWGDPVITDGFSSQNHVNHQQPQRHVNLDDLNKLSNNQSNCWRLVTPWRPCLMIDMTGWNRLEWFCVTKTIEHQH